MKRYTNAEQEDLHKMVCSRLDPYLIKEMKISLMIFMTAFMVYIAIYGIYTLHLLVFCALTALITIWPIIVMKVPNIAFRDITYKIVVTAFFGYAAYMSGGIYSPMLYFILFLTITVMPHTAFFYTAFTQISGIICGLGLILFFTVQEFLHLTPEPVFLFNTQIGAIVIILASGLIKMSLIDKYFKIPIKNLYEESRDIWEKKQRLIRDAQLSVMAFNCNDYSVITYSPHSKIFIDYFDNNMDGFRDKIILQIKNAKYYPTSLKGQIHITIEGKIHYFDVITTYYHKSAYSHHPEAFCLIDDITNRVNYEHSLLEARDKAIELNESKSSFLAHMSHELRTPLNAIIGFSEMMKLEILGQVPEYYKDYTHNIHNSGKYLLAIVNDVLDMARIESGKYTPHITNFPPIAPVEDAMMLIRDMAKRKNIIVNIEQNIASDKKIHSDEQAIKQILVNLLSNAIHYCPAFTKVIVHIGYNEKKEIIYEVRDTGKGFSEKILKNFGSPFNIEKNPLIGGHKSTGLGLAIIKGLTETLNGTVKAFNAPEGGAVIHIAVPDFKEAA